MEATLLLKFLRQQQKIWYASYCMSLKPKVGTWDGKTFFPYTHTSQTQKSNCKMNVVSINLKANMAMNAL
jgi:hypothetical protein